MCACVFNRSHQATRRSGCVLHGHESSSLEEEILEYGRWARGVFGKFLKPATAHNLDGGYDLNFRVHRCFNHRLMLRISSILVGLPSATIRCRLSVLSVMRGGRSLMLLQEEHMHTAVGSCACPPIVLIRVTGVATCNRQPGSQVCRLFREF